MWARTLFVTRSIGPLPDVVVDVTLVGKNGFVLALPNDAGSDRIFEDIAASTTLDVDDADSVEAALVKIFAAVYEAAGEMRPL
jgi:hypothetical protein